jgi:hypothetical protein
MTIDVYTACEAIGGAATAIGGVYTACHKLMARSKKKKEAYRQALLKEAKEEAEKIKDDLESKINRLKVDFETQKSNISKDLEFFKQTHNSQINVLGEKIETLRSDLASQHSALLTLLTKLVSR